MRECAEMVSQFIREDAGVGDAEARLLGMALVGMAQVSSRYWLSTDDAIGKDAAEDLLVPAGLARHQRLADDARLTARLAARFARGVALREPDRSVPAGDRVSLERGEGSAVEVRIGMQSVPRELVVETGMSQEESRPRWPRPSQPTAASSRCRTRRAARYSCRPSKIAYVEVGGQDSRRIGFR